MTEPEPNCCAACGRPKPVEFKQQTAYHVSFLAPAGIHRDIIVAETPHQALQTALQRSESKEFKPDFDPDENDLRIQRITVQHPDGDDEQAAWTDPDYLTELHADEILDELEGLIEAADDLSEAKDALDSRISDIIACGESAAIALKTIRRVGGAQ